MLSNDEMKLLNEMKDNCIKQANYVDPNAMLKYNLLTKLSFISQKIENIQKILVNSKEYAMELNDKQSVLIEIINEIDKEV